MHFYVTVVITGTICTVYTAIVRTTHVYTALSSHSPRHSPRRRVHRRVANEIVVLKITINDTIIIFLKLQSAISNRNSFRVLFDKIVSVYFI